MSLSLFLAVAVAAAGVVPPAWAAEQHRDANVYAYWNYDSNEGFRDVQQKVRIKQKAPYSFWAHYWTWMGSDQGGYLGLQTDGNRFDGTTGETAIFSLWNADSARGPGCGTFGGEGEGYSCRIPFRIRTDKTYRLSVRRVAPDETGQWWAASVRDLTAGKTHAIGRIRVALTARLIAAPMNFSEYFGPAVDCNEVPVSVALWSSPEANRLAKGGFRYDSTRGTSARGACTGGGVTPHRFGTQGVKVVQGGPM